MVRAGADLTIRLNRVIAPITTLGPGRRLGIWVQGCTLACPGCASVDTWDAAGGFAIGVGDLAAALAERIQHDELSGLTLTGGEPFQQAGACAHLLDQVVSAVAQPLDVVVFTGYTYRAAARISPTLVALADGVVCGRYRREQAGDDLLLGSTNQQIVWADPAAEARFTAWRDTDPPRLEAMVDDQDVYLVGVPGPSDLDRFSARLNARGVELQATSWEA